VPVKVDVGRRIKELRQRHNITLKDIESRVDVSATHVSEIERGKTSPTVGALRKIATALQVDPALFLVAENLPDVAVVRRDQRRALLLEGEGIRMEPLSGAVPQQELSVMLLTIQPSQGHGALRVQEGEQFGLVLSGALELLLDGRVLSVREGESIHFRGDVPHRLACAGAQPCRALWACVPKFGI
jgi:transcriptional regulator with XRE-family HTH domain